MGWHRRDTQASLPDWDDGGYTDDQLDEIFGDDAEGSEALARWKDRLGEFVERQGALDALRLRPPSEPPWPHADNPMVGYLVERSAEIADEQDVQAALAWLSANAWFEGAIAERSRISRVIHED